MVLTMCRFRVLIGDQHGAEDAAAAARRHMIYYSEELAIEDQHGRDRQALRRHRRGACATRVVVLSTHSCKLS